MVKISVEHGEYDENEIVLRCKQLDDEMLEIISLLNARMNKLVAYADGETHVISPAEVYYADAVDGKTFIYTQGSVLQTQHSLARLEELFGSAGFIRIAKSLLVNLYKVKKLRSMPNSRIELTLQNDERLVASRHYVQEIKEKLGM